ncbi:MAG: PspC domain-containing protein [Kiritimatiellia bacterium]
MADLYRSGNQKVIAGVCAGLADRFDLNLTGVRWATALVSLFLTGIPVIVYLVLWAVLKERSTGGANA